jgi:hypothetical protein
MHAASSVHFAFDGMLLESARDGRGGGSARDEALLSSHHATPDPHASPRGADEPLAAVSPQAARASDDGQLRSCQVPGCSSEPFHPRSYLGRCRLCVLHIRADTVQVGDELLRFCQKCVPRAFGAAPTAAFRQQASAAVSSQPD